MKREFLKKTICLLMLLILALSTTGCGTKAKKNTTTTYSLECCGKATLYSNGSLEVKKCNYFVCSTSTGKWKKPANNYYEFYTTDGKHHAWGQLSGKTMSIDLSK